MERVMPTCASRLDNLPPYVFAVIGDRIRQMQADGIDVIRLDIGSPDMPPPDAVIQSLHNSARRADNHGYSGYRGTLTFRQAVADYYRSRFGVVLDPDTEVLPLIGSKEGIVNLSLAYLGDGDLAIVPDIGYPSYSMGALLAGAQVYWMSLRPENDYQPDVAQIPPDIARQAKLLWVNYPNNPTGVSVSRDFYTRVAAFCAENGILLVSDNPYMDVQFDGNTACSALEVSSDHRGVIEFMSFSKSFNMAGWRLGAAVGSADAVATLLRVKSNVDSGHFKAVYDAGIAALQTPQSWINERNCVYQARRDRILQVLPRIGLSARVPQGALYIWARVEELDVEEYVEQALSEAHVSIAPGPAYGPGGEGYVRLSIGAADDRLEIALMALERWYGGLKSRKLR